jgi:hypothetical protein
LTTGRFGDNDMRSWSTSPRSKSAGAFLSAPKLIVVTKHSDHSETDSGDYLARALARKQITQEEHDAGRAWQTLHRTASAGDEKAKQLLDELDARFVQEASSIFQFAGALLDGDAGLARRRRGDDLFLSPSLNKEHRRGRGGSHRFALRCRQLLVDVLSSRDVPGGATALQQAVGQRTGSIKTSSRFMKKAGRELRTALRVLAKIIPSLGQSRGFVLNARRLSGTNNFDVKRGLRFVLGHEYSEHEQKHLAALRLANDLGLVVFCVAGEEDDPDRRTFAIGVVDGEMVSVLRTDLSIDQAVRLLNATKSAGVAKANKARSRGRPPTVAAVRKNLRSRLRA